MRHCTSATSMKEEEIRSVLQRHVRATRLRGCAAFDDLASVLRTHPVWSQKLDEVEALRVAPKRDATYLYVRKHGRWFAVSWRACIVRMRRQRCDALPREVQQLHSAMRTAIRRQLATWRKANAPKGALCSSCGATATRASPLQVDHADPPFKTLRDMFLATCAPESLPLRFGYGVSHASAFLPENKALARQWQRFHQERATYQILCKPCNASKGARPRCLHDLGDSVADHANKQPDALASSESNVLATSSVETEGSEAREFTQ